MTSTDIYFKPTYLYIKQHSITGKLYFGKTVKSDPTKYLGSGIRWVRHIKKHGKEHVVTLWYCLFLDQQTIYDFSTMFSLQENIVNSDEWLNLIPENGIDNTVLGMSNRNIGSKRTPEQLKRMSDAQKKVNRHGKTASSETRKKMSISQSKRVPQKCSDETKTILRQIRKLQPPPNKGRVFSEEARKNMSTSHLGIPSPKKGIPQPKIQCPHCNKIGGQTPMKRYHFDKCKLII